VVRLVPGFELGPGPSLALESGKGRLVRVDSGQAVAVNERSLRQHLRPVQADLDLGRQLVQVGRLRVAAARASGGVRVGRDQSACPADDPRDRLGHQGRLGRGLRAAGAAGGVVEGVALDVDLDVVVVEGVVVGSVHCGHRLVHVDQGDGQVAGGRRGRVVVRGGVEGGVDDAVLVALVQVLLVRGRLQRVGHGGGCAGGGGSGGLLLLAAGWCEMFGSLLWSQYFTSPTVS